jgi:hypothetical protein
MVMTPDCPKLKVLAIKQHLTSVMSTVEIGLTVSEIMLTWALEGF